MGGVHRAPASPPGLRSSPSSPAPPPTAEGVAVLVQPVHRREDDRVHADRPVVAGDGDKVRLGPWHRPPHPVLCLCDRVELDAVARHERRLAVRSRDDEVVAVGKVCSGAVQREQQEAWQQRGAAAGGWGAALPHASLSRGRSRAACPCRSARPRAGRRRACRPSTRGSECPSLGRGWVASGSGEQEEEEACPCTLRPHHHPCPWMGSTRGPRRARTAR